jgi:murein L,D-transpeptidase YcbB/YkuD
VLVTSRKIEETNKPLILKLHQLGLLDSIATTIAAAALQEKVKEAQRQFSLQVDGVIGNNTLQELNVPLSARLQQLTLSINYYRWLSCLAQNQSVITVNIPAAYLKVYRNNKTVLEMRMIVGKKSTPTPTLTSRVNKAILYPYWHVPYSIATKELLPAIKRNPGYIDAGNYQVLNSAGKIMDPYSINWNALSRSYFPYIIRQSTGCDNALGLIKLDFSNPFSVYLHDTPNKSLFMRNKRFFSHGCMRMEKPMEMGHLVLKDNRLAIDTLTQMGCLLNQKPIYVDADEKMPVIVWYNPAGTDSTGRVLFYYDVYRKF